MTSSADSLKGITSGDHIEILKSLIALGNLGREGQSLSKELVDAVLLLFNYNYRDQTSPDRIELESIIRSEAIDCLGFSHRDPRAFEPIVAQTATGSVTDEVFEAALRSIFAIQNSHDYLKAAALSYFINIALNTSLTTSIRKEAYLYAMRAAGKISVQTWSQLQSTDIEIDSDKLKMITPSNEPEMD